MRNAGWIVSQIGSRQRYAVAEALHAAGRLTMLYTDVRRPPAWAFLRALPGPMGNLVARYSDQIPCWQGLGTPRSVALSLRRPYAACLGRSRPF